LIALLLISALFPASSAHAASAPFLDISWTAPTTKEDGSPLVPATDLAGYSIYYSTSSLTNTIPPCGGTKVDVDGGVTTTYRLTSLTQGATYYVKVTARDTIANESQCSAEASGVAQPEYLLTVNKAGSGTGTVTSCVVLPTGIPQLSR
jgi:hypothetical protein